MEQVETQTTENVYLKLYNYDFKGCPKFMEGWMKIRQLVPDNVTDAYIKAQVFFYSRQVEPVDLSEYCQWLKSSGKEVKALEIEKKDAEPSDNNEDITNNIDQQVNIDNNDPVMADRQPANFGELIEMVQKGIKLPGVEELNIEPTNESPSPAKLDRPKKPWET